MAILRALAAGEGYPGRLAKFRYPHYKKSEREIAEQLTGHWREDHLFSLQQALKMYDAIQERIADYEREILRKPGDMEREERNSADNRCLRSETLRAPVRSHASLEDVEQICLLSRFESPRSRESEIDPLCGLLSLPRRAIISSQLNRIVTRRQKIR
jgi:hypothetical protein